MQRSDNHDLLVFRFVSLWLDDNNKYEPAIHKLLEQKINYIPSYKFIPLVPQLAPHISNVKDNFTKHVYNVVKRCALEHPHHALPIILALKNLHSDGKYLGMVNPNPEARVLGAKELFYDLSSSNIRPIVQEMQQISEALVMLAYFTIEKNKGNKSNIFKNMSM